MCAPPAPHTADMNAKRKEWKNIYGNVSAHCVQFRQIISLEFVFLISSSSVLISSCLFCVCFGMLQWICYVFLFVFSIHEWSKKKRRKLYNDSKALSSMRTMKNKSVRRKRKMCSCLSSTTASSSRQQQKVKHNCACLRMVGAKMDHICNSFTNILLRRVVVRRCQRAPELPCCFTHVWTACASLGMHASYEVQYALQSTTYVFTINYNRTCERCEHMSFAKARLGICSLCACACVCLWMVDGAMHQIRFCRTFH